MTVNRKPSRKPSGPPTYAPTTRPVYRGGSAAYPLSFATLGISATGFIFDGSASAFCTDSAGTTACASSGSDPVGYIEDMSGNGNHLIQATSGNKPVYYTNNGVKAARGGSVSSVQRFMRPTTDTFVTTAHTCISVFRRRAVVNNGTEVFSNLVGGSWGDGYFISGLAQGATSVQYQCRSAADNHLNALGPAEGECVVLVSVRNSFADTDLYVYDSAGALADSALNNALQDANPTNKITIIGYDGATSDTVDVAFCMFANEALNSTQIATIVAYLASKFGAWV